MRQTIANFRQQGYRGLLVIDTPNWSHLYDDTRMTGIEDYDASLTGRANIAYARHDYASEFPGLVWDGTKWINENGGAAREHILIETEAGNFNNGTSNTAWSSDALGFLAARPRAQPNFAGASAFLFGNWLDPNAMTGTAYGSPTTWGNQVRTYLAAAGATPIPNG